MKNATSWFSIPAEDFDRAKKFYEAVYGSELEVMEMDGDTMLMLPSGDMKAGATGGAVTKGPGRVPTKDGTIVYLNLEEDLATVLERVKESGGEVKMEKTAMGEEGFLAQMVDCEGNVVGLYSEK